MHHYKLCAKKKNYFIVKGQDTTHCQKLDYRTNAQGYLAGLEYTDDEGKMWRWMEGKMFPMLLPFAWIM